MYFDFLKLPSEMTNSELEAEYKAVFSDEFNDCLTDEKLSFQMKSDLIEHKNEVIQEMQFRNGESAFYPLMTFGFFDSF